MSAGVTVRFLRALAARLHAEGFDAARELREGGVPEAALFSPEARVSHAQFAAVWARAEALAGAELGLRTVESIDFDVVETEHPASEYLVELLVAHSATVGEGLDRLSRHYDLVHGSVELTVRRNADGADVTWRFPKGCPEPASMTEFLVASVVRLLATFAAAALVPAEIWFPHGAPASDAAHRRVLGSPARFEAGAAGFALSAETLAQPLRAARPAAVTALERRARAVRERLTRTALACDLRARLARGFDGGTPSVDDLAAELGVSSRDLSRKLRAAGTSLRTLLDEQRAAQARRFLLDEGLPVNEVATRLGFAEQSAFNRAFRRWFGCTPSALRERGLPRR